MKLILFPTAMERDACLPGLHLAVSAESFHAGICGFGIVAAGIETARQINTHQPTEILLLGIAGAYRPADLEAGVFQFTHVACDGIGVGHGDSFQSASQLGWSQWPGDDVHPPLGDELDLGSPSPDDQRQLLTVTAASADANHAAQRQQRWPAAIAEDMEGFAVAMAGCRANVPVSIIRGLSNVAGDRDHAHWQIERALKLATERAIQHLERPSS